MMSTFWNAIFIIWFLTKVRHINFRFSKKQNMLQFPSPKDNDLRLSGSEGPAKALVQDRGSIRMAHPRYVF